MKQKMTVRNGAAMLWAVLVMLMIAIISSGIILISRLYYVREQEENYQLQAQLYAESAVEIVSNDILSGSLTYLTENNVTKTYDIQFPDVTNWECVLTVSHSVVNMSEGVTAEEKKNSGEIYLTAKVSRETPGGKKLELASVCARMTYRNHNWVFDGYYNL